MNRYKKAKEDQRSADVAVKKRGKEVKERNTSDSSR
jgi:hypothetical protein